MAADDYTPQPDDPIGGNPIVFRPSTFARHAKVVDYIERTNRARYPMDGRGRTTKPSSGAWGYLAPARTIAGVSGLTLGTGNVQLCSRSGDVLTADGQTIPVLNPGGEITGPKVLELSWTDGEWAVCECGDCRVCVTVKDCFGVAISGASVTVTHDGYVDFTCTTDMLGQCCVTVPDGSYYGLHTVEATKTGYSTANKDVDVECPGVTNVNLVLATTGGNSVTFFVRGCNDQPLQNARISINSGVYTTDASGQAIFSLPDGTWPYTVEWHPRFDTYSGSITIVACGGGNQTINMVVATGYHCVTVFTCPPIDPALPFADALNATHSIYGAFALNYDIVFGGWHATITGATYPGGCGTPGCPPASNITINCQFDPVAMGYSCTGPFAPFCPLDVTLAGGRFAGIGNTTGTTCANFPGVRIVVDYPACGGIFLPPPGSTDDLTRINYVDATLTITE